MPDTATSEDGGSHPWRWTALWLAAAIATAATLLGGGVLVYRAVNDAQQRRPNLVGALPGQAADPADPAGLGQRSGDASPAPGLPDGVTSLFQGNAAGAVAAALDAAVAGGPSAFTSIEVYPDHAVATAQDPADPTQTLPVEWRPTGVSSGVTTFHEDNFTASLFGVADIDWTVIPPLVAQAPSQSDQPGTTVTRVVVLRWGYDPALPLRILVYLSNDRFVEAATDGSVVALR